MTLLIVSLLSLVCAVASAWFGRAVLGSEAMGMTGLVLSAITAGHFALAWRTWRAGRRAPVRAVQETAHLPSIQQNAQRLHGSIVRLDADAETRHGDDRRSSGASVAVTRAGRHHAAEDCDASAPRVALRGAETAPEPHGQARQAHQARWARQAE